MMIYLIILILIELEVAWDWYHITRKRQVPNYSGSNLVRLLTGILLWIAAPFILPGLTLDQWWTIPAMAFFVFWFVFDWHLNIARREPYWYLGDRSRLDRWQRANGGAFRWFWIKAALAAISITIFELGYTNIKNTIASIF